MPITMDSRISLQKLEAFCLVVRLGSVSRAAEKMYVTQPVVSAHLHTLQERMGVALLQRAGRGLELTEAGKAVHAWAEDLLRRRDDLCHQLDDMALGIAGAVHLSSSMSVGNHVLPPVLMQFRRDHPGARLTLAISAPELAVEAVEAGRTDFCVVASFGSVNTNRLDARMIGKQRYALVGAPDDPDLPESVDVEQLRKLPFICPPGGQAIRRSQDAALAALGVTNRDVVIELGSAEAMKQAVQGHLGVALLWESSVATDIAEGRLREIRVDAPDMVDSLYIVKLANKHLSPLQAKLYERVSAVLTDGAPGLALLPSA